MVNRYLFLTLVVFGCIVRVMAEPISEAKLEMLRKDFDIAIAKRQWENAQKLIDQVEKAERAITARKWQKDLIQAKGIAQEKQKESAKKPAVKETQPEEKKRAELAKKLAEVNKTTNAREILGVRSNASDEEMKNAWQKLKAEWSPANHPEDPETAREIVQRINWAYSIWNIKQ